MNDNKSFDRFVAEAFDREGPGRPVPDAIHDELLSHAGRKRQWPVWLASLKEPPMRHSNHLAVGSPTVRAAAVMAATLLLALLLAGAGIAGARLLAADGTIVVDQSGGGDFLTITEAVAVAEDGDTILVKAGVYPESVTITRAVELRGEDAATVIIEAGAGCTYDDEAETHDCDPAVPFYDGFWWGPSPYGLLLDGSDARLRDLGFRFGGDATGIVVNGGAPHIEGIVYETDNPFNNLYIHGGSEAVVRGNDFVESNIVVAGPSAVTVEGNTFGAIFASTPLAGGPTIVRDNRASQIVFDGLAVVEGNDVQADRGVSPEEDPAILVEGGDGWVIRGNTVRGSANPGGAITISTTVGSGTVSGNTLADNVIGIAVSGRTRLEGNSISDGTTGIVITRGSPELVDNTVERMSDVGIIMGRSSPTLQGNRACGNGTDLRISGNSSPLIDDSNEFCVVEDQRADG